MAAAAVTDKQLKASFKEGGKKGQDLQGMADLGGIKFFTVVTETVEGQWPLLEEVMKGANVEVDPEGEERKGGAGQLGKLFLSASVGALLFYFHVPADVAGLALQEWCDEVALPLGATVLAQDEHFLKAEAKGDPAREMFPLKMRDTAVNTSFALLRKKGLVLDDDDDEVDLSELQEAAGIEW